MLQDGRVRIQGVERGFKISIIEGFVSVFASALSGSMIIPFFIRLGAGAEELGLYTALTMALVPPSQFLAALILDRWRANRLKLMTFCALAARLKWLLMAAIASGLGGGLKEAMVLNIALLPLENLAGLAWSDLIADLVDPAIRGRAFALRNTILGLASMLGFTTAVAIYSLPYPLGYIYGFALGAVLLVATVPLLYLYGDPIKPSGGASLRLALKAVDWRVTLTDSAAMAAWNSSVSLVGAIWTYHLFNVIGADESWVALLNVAASLTRMVTNVIWGKAYDRFGPKGVVKLAGPWIALIPAAFPHLRSLNGQLGLQVYATFLWTGFSLAAFNYAISVDPAYRHVYIAVYNSIPALASSASSYVGALVYERYGIVAFYISGVARLAALALLMRIISGRGVKYEELNLSANFYRLMFVSRDLVAYAAVEIFYAVKLIYAVFILLFLSWLLFTVYYVALKLIGSFPLKP